jgi:hypothetical protein
MPASPSRASLLRRALAAPGVALLMLGCASAAVPEARYAPAERLAGTWRWVSSLDVNTQQLRTPATEGFGAELQFRPQTRTSGTFTYRRDGEEPVDGVFSIWFEGAPGNDFIVPEPGTDFLARNAWVAAGANDLHLGGVMELGYNSSYVRATN